MRTSYRYWTLNPNADVVEPRESPEDPVANLARRSGSRNSKNGRDQEGVNGNGKGNAPGGNDYRPNGDGYRANDSPV